MASESSGNDFEGGVARWQRLDFAILNIFNESDIDGSDGSGEVTEDSETDSVTDSKYDTDSDKVYSYFDGDIEWRNSPSCSRSFYRVDGFENHHLVSDASMALDLNIPLNMQRLNW